MDLLDSIAEFSERAIKPIAREVDLTCKFPSELLHEIAEKKFLSVVYPTELGGANLDPLEQGLFTERVAKYCSNVKNLFLVSMCMVGGTILKCGTEQQVRCWLPALMSGDMIGALALTEPAVGSDTSNIETRFEPTDGGYRITGRKRWITLGGMADLLLVAARYKGVMGVFLVEAERPGVAVKNIDGLLGNRASSIAAIEMKDVVVPKTHLLGDLSSKMSRVVTVALDIGRYHTAWGAVALAKACLEEMISYARSRSQFGQKLRAHQLIQKMIGDSVANIHASRSLAIEAGRARAVDEENASYLTTIAKYNCSRMVIQVSQDAMQVHGGNGYSNEYPVERYFREAKAFEVIEGTSEILVQVIAKQAMMFE